MELRIKDCLRSKELLMKCQNNSASRKVCLTYDCGHSTDDAYGRHETGEPTPEAGRGHQGEQDLEGEEKYEDEYVPTRKGFF